MTRHDWHKLVLACPTCGVKIDITDISCSADGEILVDLVCKPCDKKLNFITTGAKLILKALTIDLEETKKPAEPKPLKPPLKKLTSQSDKDFLKDMGIEGGI